MSLVPHPLFIGLFAELPEPGSEFDDEAQARWLAAAEGVLGFLYAPPSMRAEPVFLAPELLEPRGRAAGGVE